jgi:hypothetical protein
MYRQIFVGLCCALLCLCSYQARGQSSADTLDWQTAGKLAWADFQGPPEDDILVGARTFTTLKYTLIDDDTACRVIVHCWFLKKMSWRSDKDTSRYKLQHEQGHFDITEIYARKLRKAYREYEYSKMSLAGDIATIFSRICAEKTECNNAYDKETINSLYGKKQAEWDQNIASMLNELKSYSSN